MKHGIPGLAKAAAVLALFALGVVWSAPALAVDDANPVDSAAPAQQRPVKLPTLKLGEIRRGDVILLTERGMERAQPAMLAQQTAAKASPFAGMCIMR